MNSLVSLRRGSGLISMKRGLDRAAMARANTLRSLTPACLARLTRSLNASMSSSGSSK
jgi:hypothetical protein